MKKIVLILLSLMVLNGCSLALESSSSKEEVDETRYLLRGVVLSFDYNEPDLTKLIVDKEGVFFYLDNSETIDGIPVTQFQIGDYLRSSGIHFHFGTVNVQGEVYQTTKAEGVFTLYYHGIENQIITPYYIYQHLDTDEYKLEPVTGYHLSKNSLELSSRVHSEYKIEDVVIDEVDFELIIKGIDRLESVQAIIKNANHEVVSQHDIALENTSLTVCDDCYVIIEEIYQNSVVRTVIETKTFHEMKVINAIGYAEIVHLEVDFE